MVDTSAPLLQTPTWAIAIVCSFLITISILIEHALNLLTKFLEKRRRKSLIQALSKVKAELMLFGFISLLLTVMEQPISKICIPKSVGDTFLPCKNRTLRSNILEEEEPTCLKKGKISLLSRTGTNELHILIFLLAFFHFLSCLITLALGMAKMKKWETWEEETKTFEYQCSNDPRRFRLTQQTSFGRRHLKFWSENPVLRLPVCFLRLFTGSVSKADYLTLRHGFIMAHMSQGSNFDFQRFLSRALDEDFVVVAGISLRIWIFSVLFIFFNAYGFHNYLWLPFIPLLMVLVVGTKLQLIITKMCLESHNQSVVVSGTLLVKPSDHHFWFGRPQFLLHLIHFILFQNSFQLAFFIWTWYKFGLRSCFHRETEDIVIKMVMGVLVQVLIGYVILPLYGLVTQMGSSTKKVIFTEHVADHLKKWHSTARRNLGTIKPTSIGTPSTQPSYSNAMRDIDTQELEIEETQNTAQNIEFVTPDLREWEGNSHPNIKETYLREFSFKGP